MRQEKIVEVEGLSLWTESIGTELGEPILLVAGAGSHARFWSDAFCERFVERGYRVIRYDHRDVGHSGTSSEDYEIDTLVGDAASIIDAYSLQGAHVVGHSMGGYLGQFMATTHPKWMRSLTVIAAGPLGATEEVMRPYTPEETQVMHQTWLPMMRNRPKENFEESLEGFLGVWRRLNGTAPFDEELAIAYTKELYDRSHDITQPKHAKVMEKIAESLEENQALLDQINLPLLLIQGEEDYLLSPARGVEALAQAIPHAELTLIPQMGHLFFNREIERQLVDRIVTFLDELSKK